MLPTVPNQPNFNSTDKLLKGRMVPLFPVLINTDNKFVGLPVSASTKAAADTSIFSGKSIFTDCPLSETLYSL
jgi:hypothetical protein